MEAGAVLEEDAGALEEVDPEDLAEADLVDFQEGQVGADLYLVVLHLVDRETTEEEAADPISQLQGWLMILKRTSEDRF